MGGDGRSLRVGDIVGVDVLGVKEGEDGVNGKEIVEL